MKMLLITSSFPQNNRISGVFIPDTIHALNSFGVSVHVLTQNCEGSASITSELWPGCTVTYFGWSGGGTPLIERMKQKLGIFYAIQYLIKSLFSGRRICRNWKPDIIFAEWLIPAGFTSRILSILTGIPYCCRALGSDIYIALSSSLLGPLIKSVAKNSSILFADGFDLCRKTSALANGKECHFAATARKLENKKSGFSPFDDRGLFTFCSVGRLHQVKGFNFLIMACSILLEKGINFRCYIIGDGEEKEALKILIKSLDLDKKVILTGRLEDGDISDLFHHTDCIAIPSLSESIPLVLSEAVNAKKPLIVTNVGDMGFLAEKFNLGYVVEKENYNALAEALIKMSNTEIRSSFSNKQNYEELSSILSPDSGAKAIYEKIKGLLS
jgi:glycosyltransferase involved in cell wall biosynthesis